MGQAAARALIQDGVKVILNDIDGEMLEKSASEIDGDTITSLFDISNSEKVKETLKSLGEIDILVNNAGILSTGKLLSTSDDEWRRVMQVNLDGAFMLSRAVVPGMKRRGWGRIINVSSLAAKSGGITAGIAYATSKGALVSLTFSLARELAPFGITVNGIAPAYVRTRMITEGHTEEQRQKLLGEIPVGRFCEPEEFGHVVRFLAHPLAGYITGEIIDLNGGLLFD